MREKFYRHRRMKGIDSSMIKFKNFDCEHGGIKYPKTPYPHFYIRLPEHLAEDMRKEGWYVQQYVPGPNAKEGAESYPMIKVTIRTYKEPELQSKNPNIVELANGKATPIMWDEIGNLQKYDIEKISVDISPYCKGDKFEERGATAYLSSMNVFIRSSEIDEEREAYINSFKDSDDDEDDFEEEAPF